MSNYVAKYVSKRILGETLQNKFGAEDPYFEQVPASRISWRGQKKLKKRRKALPPGISEHDGMVLTKVKRRAYRLDMALFSFLGVRFGWSSAIGIIPMVGDVADALLALMVLRTCEQIEGGLPSALRMRMMFNIVLDFAIGLVPFAGDLADAVFRANTRNAVLLERHLREKGKKNLRKNGQPVPQTDPSDELEFDREQERADHAPDAFEHSRHETGVQDVDPAPPQPARPKESRGWFGRDRARPRDAEMGEAGL